MSLESRLWSNLSENIHRYRTESKSKTSGTRNAKVVEDAEALSADIQAARAQAQEFQAQMEEEKGQAADTATAAATAGPTIPSIPASESDDEQAEDPEARRERLNNALGAALDRYTTDEAVDPEHDAAAAVFGQLGNSFGIAYGSSDLGGDLGGDFDSTVGRTTNADLGGNHGASNGTSLGSGLDGLDGNLGGGLGGGLGGAADIGLAGGVGGLGGGVGGLGGGLGGALDSGTDGLTSGFDGGLGDGMGSGTSGSPNGSIGIGGGGHQGGNLSSTAVVRSQLEGSAASNLLDAGLLDDGLNGLLDDDGQTHTIFPATHTEAATSAASEHGNDETKQEDAPRRWNGKAAAPPPPPQPSVVSQKLAQLDHDDEDDEDRNSGGGDGERSQSRLVLPDWLQVKLDTMCSNVGRLTATFPEDVTLLQYAAKAKTSWAELKTRRKNEPDAPLFLFKDGPLTKAAKSSQPILLEDFDQPSQAVTERLNSLLEPTPVFSITEDITNSDPKDLGVGTENNADDVQLQPGFQVFATIHRRSDTERLKVSPATRSRFTEIRAPS